jgi:CO/xanthine dehydrogenase FAD-binding subunit
VPMLNMRVAQLRIVVDIMRVPELNRIESAGDTLRVGAAVRQSELERRSDLASRQPLLAAALPWIGHAQTRSRGTVCGSVAHADPSAELPLVLIALGGEVEARSQQRKRRIPAETFFTGMMTTDLRRRPAPASPLRSRRKARTFAPSKALLRQRIAFRRCRRLFARSSDCSAASVRRVF